MIKTRIPIERWLPFIVAVLPAIVGLLAFAVRARFDWSIFVPYWNDEIVHWHEAATFSVAGLNGGYYTINELPAPISFTHFYSWGVALPALYGAVIGVFGQSLVVIPFFHAVVVALALYLFIKVARLDWRQMLFVGAFALTYLPFHLYLPTLMQEGLQIALAIVMAAGFSAVLRHERGTPERRRAVLMVAVLIIVIAQTRATWAFMLIPLMALIMRLPVALLIGGFASVVLVFITQQFAAPNPTALNDALSIMRTDPLGAFNLLAGQAIQNALHLLIGIPFEMVFRIQFAVVAIYFGLRWRKGERDRLAFGILALFIGFLIALWYVSDWRSYRHLAPALLLVTLLLIEWKRYRIVAVLLVGSLIILMMPSSLETYRVWSTWRINPAKHQSYIEWQERLEGVLQYEPDAPNAWCNTVLMSADYLDTEIALAVEPGIGLSFLWEARVSVQIPRSRYLLLRDDETRLRIDELNVERLLDVPNGALYLNLDAEC